MSKPGDDIKHEPLYQALAALGTKHQSMKPEVLRGYNVILKAPEVQRRAGRQTSFDQLAATARVTISAAIQEMHNSRENDIAKAVMCALPEYENRKVKERIGKLEKRHPDLDREVYKYERLIVLERIYHFLTREPSPDNDWRSLRGWPMNPAGWEVAPELLPILGRLRFRIAQLRYGALGTAFVSRFNDRLLADGVHVPGYGYTIPGRRYVLSADYDDTWPVAGDFFLGPCMRFILARDEFEDKFAAWRGTYTSIWQENSLSRKLDNLEQFEPGIRSTLKEWTAMPATKRKDHPEIGETLKAFYCERWYGWLLYTAPRYATSHHNILEHVAYESWELLITLRDLFGYDPNPNQSAQTEIEEMLLAYYQRVSSSIAIDRKPLRTVIAQYLKRETQLGREAPIAWHELHYGTKYLHDIYNRFQ
jgi:hypothetical protein